MKTKIFLLIIIGLLTILAKPVALAQSPTPSPTSQEDKIKDIRDAVKEKVKEKIEQITQGQPKAYVGKITEINDSILNLATLTGEKQVKVTLETKIFDKNRKEIKTVDLEVSNYIIAMGFLTENEIMEARRIIIFQQPKIIKREVAFGRVTDISEEKILTIKNEKKNISYMVETTDKTKITKKVDNKIQKVNFEAININDRVVVIGTVSENEETIISAKIIHVIPGKALGSEKPKPTPTSKPKTTPSPTPEE